jgi:hypothetical protein
MKEVLVERCCQMKGGIGGELLPDERRYWWRGAAR